MGALIGLAGNRINPNWFTSTAGHGGAGGAAQVPAAIDSAFAREVPEHVRPSLARFAVVAVIGAIVWLGPVAVLYALHAGVFATIAAFNAKMAVVTFGGAYAVLAYIAQQAVEHFHWLKPSEMLVGLSFAETTPGPLISVVRVRRLHGGWRAGVNRGPPTLFGGGLAMDDFRFSFLWIFLGGPFRAPSQQDPQRGVVGHHGRRGGVILNRRVAVAARSSAGRCLACWVLALNAPVRATINWPALAVCGGYRAILAWADKIPTSWLVPQQVWPTIPLAP
jgi:hypothetical protein